MSTSITVFHVRDRQPEEVESALNAIFAREERPGVLRVEGTYSAVLARATSPELNASYRYLICRPPHTSQWTPVLEVGNRTDGLEIELSRTLSSATICALFVYGDVVSGYRVVRDGQECDRYLSDPTYSLDEDEKDGTATLSEPDFLAIRGQPERFADLFPAGTSPADFARVVLQPGWWEDHDAGSTADEDDLVDEEDRMRCMGLALELWSPTEYPFAQEPEDVPNAVAGPAIALAFE